MTLEDRLRLCMGYSPTLYDAMTRHIADRCFPWLDAKTRVQTRLFKQGHIVDTSILWPLASVGLVDVPSIIDHWFGDMMYYRISPSSTLLTMAKNGVTPNVLKGQLVKEGHRALGEHAYSPWVCVVICQHAYKYDVEKAVHNGQNIITALGVRNKLEAYEPHALPLNVIVELYRASHSIVPVAKWARDHGLTPGYCCTLDQLASEWDRVS